MKPLRVLVFGGRDFADRAWLNAVLNKVHGKNRRIKVVIHGGAPGADGLAGRWAREHGVIAEVYPANWKDLGPGAGPIRNQQMIDSGDPDLAIGFPGGKGTADMTVRVQAAGIKLMEPAAVIP